MSVHGDTSIPSDHKLTLLVDSIDHATMFHEVRSRLPSITSWMECSQPSLLLDNRPILSCCGVQQGDPLGPLGFALVLHSVIEKIKESVPSLLINVWYLDDGTLCGTEQELAIALSLEGPPRGLFLNKSKSLIYTPANSSITHPLLHDIPTSSDGFTLLGSPPPFVRKQSPKESVKYRSQSLDFMTSRTLNWRPLSSGPVWLYLSSLMSSAPAPPKALGFFDDIIRHALTGRPVPDWSWLKASLPSSLGGLNLRQASLHAPAAYIGSLHQCRHLVVEILGRIAPPPTHLPYSLQSLLADLIGNPSRTSMFLPSNIPFHGPLSFVALLASATHTRSKALALSTAIRHAGDWLNVVPSSTLGLHLQDREFRLCFNTGWAFRSLRRTRGALSASLLQTILGIIMWEMLMFFQRHSQPPSRPARKFLPSSRAPRIVPLMFTYPAGKEAAQPR